MCVGENPKYPGTIGNSADIWHLAVGRRRLSAVKRRSAPRNRAVIFAIGGFFGYNDAELRR